MFSLWLIGTPFGMQQADFSLKMLLKKRSGRSFSTFVFSLFSGFSLFRIRANDQPYTLNISGKGAVVKEYFK